jgi:hypothetical protein
MFSKYGVLVHENHDARGEPTTAVALWKTDQANNDPFGSSAEDISAEETREKVALFEWADQALGLGEAELEPKLDEAAKRFKRTRGTLKQLIKARRSDKKRREEARSRPHDAPEDDVRYYGPDFRVSKRGVFARRIDSEGTPFWERISTTRMDIEALTRDARAENWGTYVVITNRDGGMKKLAIPNALTAADKAAEIASLLASLGVGVVSSKLARQLIVQFLTTEVTARITSVPQIGWHRSDGTWGGSFDEIGEGEPKVIRAAVYVLANGSTKLRGTQDITLRPMESFRILGISTGEPTMMAFLSAGGEKVPAGLTVRLVDVPAEVRPESAFETCAVDQIEALGKQFYPLTTQLHGSVGRAWLQYLVDLGPDQIQARLRTDREAWLALPAIAALRATATGQVRSIVNRFALVAAALRMGIEAGLLPWTYEDTDVGVAACIARWATNRAGRLDLAGEMVSAVEQIREILAADLHGRFIHLQRNEDDGQLEYVSLSDENKRDTLGFVKDGWILVEPTAWRSVLCAGFDPEKTARHLRHEGLLVADEGKLQKQERVLRGGGPAKGRFYTLDMRILEEAAGTGPREVS